MVVNSGDYQRLSQQCRLLVIAFAIGVSGPALIKANATGEQTYIAVGIGLDVLPL
jgi:hypothetical protein